jgi:indole-3-glycerol phosphate synthase
VSSAFLTRACAEAGERVRRAEAALDLAGVTERAAAQPAPPVFADALSAPGLSVIAEIKRASPSRGHIADIPQPAALAAAYAAGGAAAISVLTEPEHFGGSLDDLRAVARRVAQPVLRKDFVVDAYQLAEARAHGAAAALLIVAALDDDDLPALMRAADDVGLDTLVETHSEGEVDRAVQAHQAAATGRRLVLGVNARNLATLDVDLSVVERVAASRPEGTVLVAESGVHGPADAARMAAVGADAVLVGEHVATAADPCAAVMALRDAARPGQQPPEPSLTTTESS